MKTFNCGCTLPENPPANWKERILNTLYMIGVCMIHYGALLQIVKIFTTQSAEDLSLPWMCFLFGGHILHLPRSFSSKYGVWKFNCLISLVLIATMITGILLYS